MMAKHFHLVLVLALSLLSSVRFQAQSLTVQVLRPGGASVLSEAYLKFAGQTCLSAANGSCIFRAEPGIYRLSLSYIGLYDTSLVVDFKRDTTIRVELRERSELLAEAQVRAEALQNAGDILENRVMRNTVDRKDLAEMPQLLGEPDLLRPLALRGGVQAGIPGGAGMYVRGGDQYHNAVFIDGVPLLNSNHAFGLASPFPVGGTQRVDFYKQDLPVEYGGALSSVMDVKLRTAELDRWSGDFAGGIGSARVALGIPLWQKKASLQASARLSTLGAIDRLASLFGSPLPQNYAFDDYSLKYHHRLDDKSLLEVLAFRQSDRVFQRNSFQSFVDPGSPAERYENTVGMASTAFSARYSRQGKGGFHQFQAYFSGYDQRFSHEPRRGSGNLDSYAFGRGLDQYGLKSTHQYSQKNGDWLLGSELRFLHERNPFVEIKQSGQSTREESQSPQGLLVPAVFARRTQRFGDRWKATAGLRLATGLGVEIAQTLLPDWRASVRYTANEHWAFFASYDRGYHWIQRFRNVIYGSALDVPLLVRPGLPVSQMEQSALGAVWAYGDLSLGLTAFYRHMENVVDRNHRQRSIDLEVIDNGPILRPERALFPVNGHAYGLEAELFYTRGIFKFQSSYTWSRAFRQSEQVDAGRPYRFEFNHEHMVNALAVLRFKRNSIDKVTEIGLNYHYGNGNFRQFPVMWQAGPSGQNLPYVPHRNNAQLPPVQHLDIVFNFIAQKKKGLRTFSISAMNLFFSPIIVDFDRAPGSPPESGTVPAISSWIFLPSLSYAYRF